MTRRAFLRLVALALLASRWRVAHAGGEMALKGIGCNNLNASLLNPLNIGWFHTAYSPAYCLTPLPDLNAETRWCMHLFDSIPNPADVQLLTANNPNYDKWWFVGGNEPDLTATSPKQTKQLTTAQIDMVLAGDPDAKFCLTMGSQLNAFGGNSAVPYIVKVWEKLDPFYRGKIRAFHTHYYAQVACGENNPAIYDTQDLKAFCNLQNMGLMELEGWNKNQKVWLTEVGLVKSTLTESDPRTISYPASVHEALEGLCGRWAWYGMENVAMYHSLYEAGLTGVGAAYAGIV